MGVEFLGSILLGTLIVDNFNRPDMEPALLWKRYLIGNLIFCGLVIRHLRSQKVD